MKRDETRKDYKILSKMVDELGMYAVLRMLLYITEENLSKNPSEQWEKNYTLLHQACANWLV